jgi:hypothetical protein
VAVAHRVIEGAGLNVGLAADGELSASGGVRSSHVLESRVGGLIDSRPAAKRLPFFWNLPGPYVVCPASQGTDTLEEGGRLGGWEIECFQWHSGKPPKRACGRLGAFR